MELLEIDKIVRQSLSEKRYYHSVCVMKKCEELAKKYGIDTQIAKKIGLAHDIAKEMPDSEKIKYARENHIEINMVEKKHVGLLHAKIGADIARKKLGFSDEMCKAISLHTTAGTNMSMLDKILYVADSTGEDRTWNDIDYVNILIEENIDKAVIYLINIEIKDKVKNQKMIHVDSILARNELISKIM